MNGPRLEMVTGHVSERLIPYLHQIGVTQRDDP